MIVTLTTGRMISSGTNSLSALTLTTGRMISSRTNSLSSEYRPSDSNTDYWEDDIVQD